MPTNAGHNFPCPVCLDPRQVKLTKKNKPYITCDPCGVQLFVRGPAGIAEFNRLTDTASSEDPWTRLKEMQRLYHLKCPRCGHRFWIEPSLIETSGWDGSLKGFRCPAKNCEAVVKWENKK